MPLSLLVSYSGILGGAERALIDFATGLQGSVCLACPDGTMADAARGAGLRVLRLRERPLALRGSPGTAARAIWALARHRREVRTLAADLEPNLVIVSGMRPALAGLLGARRLDPSVFVHHDFLPGSLLGALVRSAAQRASVVVVTSQSLAHDLDQDGRLGHRLQVVHPGVDVERFHADAAPASPPEVLVLGSLVDWKRPGMALEVCAIARRSLPSLRCRLLGAPVGPEGQRLLAELRRRAGEPDLAGAVELNGTSGDPVAALRRAICLLHCAPREPFGIAVLEALAAARPAVVPSSAGPAEIVDRSCGVLYPPGDAAAAAAAVVELASHPERIAALGAAGRRRAASQFDFKDARRKFADAVAPALRRSAEPTASPEQLAVVTVAHNSAPQLDRLLRSLERHLPGTQVVVADCGSDDESLEVATRYGSTLAVPLGANLGFGRGCNAGIGHVDAPVTALLNPDVEVLDDSLMRLVGRLLHPRHGHERLLAPLVLNPDGSRQDTAHPLPCSAADLVRALVPPSALPSRAGALLAPWRATSSRRIGWAVGCAVLGRTATLRTLGPFDERIFMYGEDLDLGLRAARDGIETWFCPDARVIHDRAHSTGAAFGGEPFALLARARHEVVLRRLGRRYARLDDAAQTVTFCSRLALKRLASRPASREREQLRALLRARK